jgi:hypothetical protein
MTAADQIPHLEKRNTGLTWPYVAVIVVLTMIVTVGITWWVLSHYLFVREFKPVELKPEEEQVLNSKLRQLGIQTQEQTGHRPEEQGREERIYIKPEPYSEQGASRQVEFFEREVNAMLARNTDLARKLAIDLSENLVSAKLLVPVENDFPVLGGKTLRVNAGVELSYKEGRPVVILKGVSIMGVPIPNAWLGNLKNVDMVQVFGGSQGGWKTFADGVEDIRVEEGRLLITLKP